MAWQLAACWLAGAVGFGDAEKRNRAPIPGHGGRYRTTEETVTTEMVTMKKNMDGIVWACIAWGIVVTIFMFVEGGGIWPRG